RTGRRLASFSGVRFIKPTPIPDTRLKPQRPCGLREPLQLVHRRLEARLKSNVSLDHLRDGRWLVPCLVPVLSYTNQPAQERAFQEWASRLRGLQVVF